MICVFLVYIYSVAMTSKLNSLRRAWERHRYANENCTQVCIQVTTIDNDMKRTITEICYKIDFIRL